MKNDPNDEQIERLLKEAGETLRQTGPIQQFDIPEHILRSFRKAKEENFPAWKELTLKEMEPLLLSVLAQRQMDGFEIISNLEKAHIRVKGAGEAVNYGILSKLVSKGFVQVDLGNPQGQKRKLYRLTERGHSQLKKSDASELHSLTAAVLAAG